MDVKLYNIECFSAIFCRMFKILIPQKHESHYLYYFFFQILFLLMLLRQIIVSTVLNLRAVVFFLFLHALGTKTWPVQQSFEQVFHGRVPRRIIAVNIKPQLRKQVKITRPSAKRPTCFFTVVSCYLWKSEGVDQTMSQLKKLIKYLLHTSLPKEGVLFSIHPRLQLQGRILPKWRHDEAEEQSD